MEKTEESILNSLFNEALSFDSDSELVEEITPYLNCIIERACGGRNRAILSVLITLLLKKVAEPEQDIRLHQKSLGGFSARSLDTKVVTPFLRQNEFPFMSEAGALTRSLEQAHPYNLDYPGRITPKEVKKAFLTVIDRVEVGKVDAKIIIIYILSALRKWRDNQIPLQLPQSLTKRRIEEIIALLLKHWDKGATSRLPVLAIYAMYECLLLEIAKYKDCKLLPLLRHNSPDSKTDRVGDIDVQGKSGEVVETVEIKHNIPITRELLDQLKSKIIRTNLKTYYLLSTIEQISEDEIPKITDFIVKVRNDYGCQIIVNGVALTLKYYLRLLDDPDQFLHKYVMQLEKDPDVFDHSREVWRQLAKEA